MSPKGALEKAIAGSKIARDVAAHVLPMVNLLRECAEVLRDDIEGCGNCNYGHGSTGLTSEGEPCEGCSHLRDLLTRIEAAL